jgi:hypothetical protein
MTTENDISPTQTETAAPLTGSTIAGTPAAFAEPTQVVPGPITAVPPSALAPSNYTFMPTTLDEAVKLAKFLSSSSIVPKTFQNEPANCFVAMQWGAELGMRPLQALQNLAVINGKPGLYGDAGKALLLAAGCQIQEDDGETVRQQGFARCTITRRGRAPVTRTFSLDDAKTAGLLNKDGPWKSYPYRQLAWRAFWFAARDAAADILRGMAGAEELADYQTIEPAAPRVEPPKAKPKAEPKLGDPIGAAIHKRKLEDDEATQENTTPASAAMIAHVFKLLERAALSTSDLTKRFPDVTETLEGATVAQINAIIKWIANPTE